MTINRNRLSKGLLAAAAVVLAGCASQSEAPETASPPPSGETQSSLAERIGTLPPQELKAGNCGMFLWARRTERNLVFFSTNNPGKARLVLDGETIDLPRTAAEGDMMFGQYTNQRFAKGPIELHVTVQPDRESGLVGGAVVRKGMLNVRGDDGWNLVLPVAGMIACKSA